VSLHLSPTEGTGESGSLSLMEWGI